MKRRKRPYIYSTKPMNANPSTIMTKPEKYTRDPLKFAMKKERFVTIQKAPI